MKPEKSQEKYQYVQMYRQTEDQFKKWKKIISFFVFFLLHEDNEEFEASLESQVMKIAIIGDRSTPASDYWMATIVVEGTTVQGEKDIPRCCALLIGIIYALNLSYCKKLKYTFEVFQKLFLDLGLKASAKVIMSLKNSIF